VVDDILTTGGSIREVMGAVIAAVLTTIAAFSPLLFMSGIIGRFIKNIPTVVIIALSASLGEALIILPSHLADFVKIKSGPDGKPVGLKKEVGKRYIILGRYVTITEIVLLQISHCVNFSVGGIGSYY